ncbi:hypothetical protein [Kineococcus rubinsiae]|uniref:hypothetical protein n=1 Tax=Kineococcus rubinsiae TaxID=2609562 RepID=UPI0014320343|nr:hypothetical protein [Kineococcus rubinsiae]NIZ90271.1 hypothetical protein [Kineococcus rubinsiae]
MIVTTSGVWVLDELQPVAAVLDPDTGALRRLVSWAQLPPPPPGEDVVVCADGDGLWVQHGRLGPLVRVDLDGVSTTVWTECLVLTAAGAGSAWCTSPAPAQELVHGAEAEPVVFVSGAVVARVDRDGRVQRVFTDAPVRAVLTSEEALWVQLDVAPWSLRNLGTETHEVVWSSCWLSLAWTGDLPDRVEAATGQSEQPTAAPAPLGGDGRWHGYLYDPEGDPDSDEVVAAAGLLWRLGWEAPTEDGPRRGTIAAAFATGTAGDDQDTPEPLQVFQLGDGIRAAAAVREHLVVVTNGVPPGRESSRVGDLHSGETLVPCVVALRPGVEPAQVWLTSDDVDISDLSWPLPPRPLDADSYTQQVLARWNRMDQYWLGPDGWHPLTQGMSGSRARLVGDWPATQLEFTFDYAPRPGVRLRRSIPLFDEVGAIANPEYADIGLMEDLDTGRTPPLEDARDGYLDM